MGLFLTNITLRGPVQDDIARHLAAIGRSAYVAPTEGGCTVIYDEQSEEQDVDVLMDAAESLSQHFGCPALATLVHDSDVLVLILYESGRLVMDYNSSPDYFDGGSDGDDEPSGPAGADPEALCRAFGSTNVQAVKTALEAHEDFAEFTLRQVVEELGLPAAAATGSYSRVQLALSEPAMMESGEAGVDVSTLRRTP